MTISINNDISTITGIQTLQLNALNPALSGNFLTFNANKEIIDSGLADANFCHISGGKEVVTAQKVFTKNITISGGGITAPLSGSDLLVYGMVQPPAQIFEIRDDFICRNIASSLGWAQVATGTGAAVAVSTTYVTSGAKAIGLVGASTGTTSGGVCSHNLSINLLLFGSHDYYMEWRMGLSNLSTSSEEFITRFGFMDSDTASDCTNGVYFEYDRAGSGDFWKICTAAAGVRTKTVTSVVPIATGMQKFGILKLAGEAAFYINGNYVGSSLTNLPNSDGQFTGVNYGIYKTVGITSRTILCDYFYLRGIGDRT